MPAAPRRRRYATLLLFSAAIGLHVWSRNPEWVERWYANGLYPFLSAGLRSLFGSLPFSIGDLAYLALILLLLRSLLSVARRLRRAGRASLLHPAAWKGVVKPALSAYVVFNLFWGLNYDRVGIDTALSIRSEADDSAYLERLSERLLERSNHYAAYSPDLRKRAFASLSDSAGSDYRRLSTSLPLPAYAYPSVKPSLFGAIGNHIGYSGYYNPLSGEAQVNTTIPPFLQPYALAHEIAHQLGYARENEANLVGFLAARASADSASRYSAYFDMFLYSNAALRRRDSLKAQAQLKRLHPHARRDLMEWRAHVERYRGPIDRLTDAFYDRFLKWNGQRDGTMSYGKVVAWLLAIFRRDGDI